MLWLGENDEMSLEFMYGAIDKDKKDGVYFYLSLLLAIDQFLKHFRKF